MQKFEYNSIRLTDLDIEKLNSLGEDGWQIVYINCYSGPTLGVRPGPYDLLLMRQVDLNTEPTNKFQEPMSMIGDLLGKIDFTKGFTVDHHPDAKTTEDAKEAMEQAAKSLKQYLKAKK